MIELLTAKLVGHLSVAQISSKEIVDVPHFLIIKKSHVILKVGNSSRIQRCHCTKGFIRILEFVNKLLFDREFDIKWKC
jgi:acyl-[acyl carrier protein]--UDP-N-acetylglucosamine O-acyltransferase